MIGILVVEDDENYRFEIKEELQGRLACRSEFYFASNFEAATQLLQTQEIDLILLDIIFPLDQKMELRDDVDYRAGVKLLDWIIRSGFDGNIVVLSSQDKTFAVDLLIRYKNVTDYVFKDSPWKEILYKIEKQIRSIRERANLLSQVQGTHAFIGHSAGIAEIRKMAKRVAPMDTTVLLTGESGSGKEVAAHYFHSQSTRAKGPFIVLNCAAVPEGLFESQLFGHRKGAFTGADRDQTGTFEAADGGTIFLDEIGELPLPMQAKLLRVLQEKSIVPVGYIRPINVDVRVIAATNRSLEEAVKNKEFREDLYYRLNVFPIKMPPLRDRPEDLSDLATCFLESFHQRTGFKRSLSKEALDLLTHHHWPGNVRELKNTIERIAILTENPIIGYTDVVDVVQFTGKEDYRVQIPYGDLDYKTAKTQVVDAFHRKFFTYHLHRNNHRIAQTAKAVGYNRNDLSKLIKKLEIPLKANSEDDDEYRG
jgi:two-component system, NtrC family, nitrogen regulation response regulator NtrX